MMRPVLKRLIAQYMKKIKTLLLLLSGHLCPAASHAQSISDSLASYFDYDALAKIPCSQSPAGIYALRFKIDNSRNPVELKFSADSLAALKSLFISSLRKCLVNPVEPRKGKEYLLLIYYNNFLGCIHDDNSRAGENANQSALNFLSRQMTSIEKSMAELNMEDSELVVLKPAVINNFNPNEPPGRGFRGDYRKARTTDLSEEKIKEIEKEAERRRRKKTEEKID